MSARFSLQGHRRLGDKGEQEGGHQDRDAARNYMRTQRNVLSVFLRFGSAAHDSEKKSPAEFVFTIAWPRKDHHKIFGQVAHHRPAENGGGTGNRIRVFSCEEMR
uniref:Uncharacterized protein n=1 Tax=Streptomyces macrosporus TaxID=44032 RepID=A0ABN3JAT1_9ACTN